MGINSVRIASHPGKGERMVAALTEVRSSLLTSLGCVPGCAGTVAHLSPAPGEVLVNTAWTFTNTSVVVPDHSFAWYVDDVQVSTATDLVHTFTTDGTHTVVLEAFNTSAGCSDTEQLLIEVGCDAQAVFTQAPMDVQPGGSVIFTSQGQGAQGHTWSVNGATVAAAPSLTWTFSEVGGYSVRLVVQGSGCTDTSAYAFVPVGDCVSGANNTLVVVGWQPSILQQRRTGGPPTSPCAVHRIRGALRASVTGMATCCSIAMVSCCTTASIN
jgi:plastocyanin